MAFREQLKQSEAYQAASEPNEAVQQQRADSVGEAVGPVVQLEKTDVQMWADVLTVVLLILIWRELVRQGGS